jgi:hypothetical protein
MFTIYQLVIRISSTQRMFKQSQPDGSVNGLVYGKSHMD